MPSLRVLDPAAARALDAAAMDRFGIPGIVLMEHAALGVARLAEAERARLGRTRALVLCGPGGNGGDGWAVARLLANRGVPVTVLPVADPTPGSDAAVNEEIARRLAAAHAAPIEILDVESLSEADLRSWIHGGSRDTLVIDALYGVGLTRPITGATAVLIDVLSSADSPVVAIDVPSGFDAMTGHPSGPCIRAIVTATMVAPKPGMLVPGASEWTGRIEVVDIGTPPSLLAEFGRVAGSAPVGDDADSLPDHGPR
jgi:hydroxyethylthiazole kinase-like uncharacterized protein yjeF